MNRFLVKTVINAVALWIAAVMVQGINLAENQSSVAERVFTIIVVALVFGIVNSLLKPLAKTLAFPFIVLTLGLFTIVINAFMLQITDWLAGPLGLSFSIGSFFWDAILGAIVISIVSMVLNYVIPDEPR
ncbi:phage holin family protein [Janibacter sp. GXQ6167]|uniref:phage holin family protein n=1 Tax=Janibacter sp. GXQ6167 TaxID=3240791 RepID=UPI0035246A9B